MRFLKLFLTFSLFSFLLAGCFNFDTDTPDDSDTANETERLYETNDYAVIIPKDWEVIEKENFTSDIPEETDIAFRNNVKNETFTATATIVERDLLDTLDSLEFANRVRNRQKDGLTDYDEISKEKYNIVVGNTSQETLFIHFAARKTTSDPLLEYFQTYVTSDDTAYIVGGAVHPNEQENTSQIVEDIVRSFRLK
ncbi:hypothetical protein GF340_04900 [Candidatus Peregrinibacteria bacterium]|nr:hypothetical protein [Candidatus Peregrinibacteria bacterium]